MNNMNLQENIERIQEVMGIDNPHLIPVEPNHYVYHMSNPFYRKHIKKVGLIPKGRSDAWLEDTNIEGKVIFASNSDDKKRWFDSTYDDDIYQIDTTKINNTWFKDPNFLFGDYSHIITFDSIPLDAIKMIHRGTGKGD
jgi:hypothetical protein